MSCRHESGLCCKTTLALPQEEEEGDEVEDVPGMGLEAGAAAAEAGDEEADADEEADEEGDQGAADAAGRRYPARTRALVQHFNPMQESHARPPGQEEVNLSCIFLLVLPGPEMRTVGLCQTASKLLCDWA